MFKGIIRPFESEEICLFYYLIDAGEFLIPMTCMKPPLVAYLERNSICKFDKMVLGYAKTAIDSPTLLKQSSQIGKFLLRKSTASGASETKSGFIVRHWL